MVGNRVPYILIVKIRGFVVSTEFKVGDRVVCNKANFAQTVGELGTITMFGTAGLPFVTWDKGSTCYAFEVEIRHVTPLEQLL